MSKARKILDSINEEKKPTEYHFGYASGFGSGDGVEIDYEDLPKEIKSVLEKGRLKSIYTLAYFPDTDSNSQQLGTYLINLNSDFVTPLGLESLSELNSKNGYYVSIRRPLLTPKKSTGIEIEISVPKT